MDYRSKFKKRKIPKVKNNSPIDFSKSLENRSKKIKIPRIIKIFIICVLLIFSVAILTSSDLFRIKKISITGNELLDTNVVMDYLNSKYLDTNIWTVFSSTIHKDLNLQYGIIDSVILDKKFPNEVKIQVFERIPEINLSCLTNTIFDNYGTEILDIKLDQFVDNTNAMLIQLKCGENISVEQIIQEKDKIFALIHLIDDNLYIDRANDKLVFNMFDKLDWQTPNYTVSFDLKENGSKQIVRFKLVRDQVIKENGEFSFMDVSSYKVLVR